MILTFKSMISSLYEAQRLIAAYRRLRSSIETGPVGRPGPRRRRDCVGMGTVFALLLPDFRKLRHHHRSPSFRVLPGGGNSNYCVDTENHNSSKSLPSPCPA